MSDAESLKRDTNPVTLTRHIMQERNQFKQASGNFAMLLQSIQLACKVIARATAKAGIANLYGVAGNINATGDEQKKLDVLANDVFINCLTFSEQVFLMVSEENDHALVLEEKDGGYAVVFDPLDGSSNIDANVSVGTIFGIYRKRDEGQGKATEKDALRPGNELVAAGYAVYGASTMIVLTTGMGVNGFSLDPTLGEFILTHPNMKIPKKGKIYSINEGNASSWDEPTRKYVEMCKKKPKDGKPKTARYIGSMVADVHRTILYGGIFMYPADSQNKSGKLRLLYECNPIAFIMEQAGGKASNGFKRILDLQPATIHGRSPIFCGSFEDVSEVEGLYKSHPAASKPQSKL